MKIAVIGAKGLPAHQGGIEHYCEEMYPGMVAQGHTVDLYARQSYTQIPWFGTYNYKGVRVISVPSIALRGVDALTNSAAGAIASILKSYDVVHFHALGPALFCFLPKLFTSAKVVVTCHGLDWQRSKWGKLSSQIIYLGEKAAVHYADEIIVVSKELQSYFLKTYGIQTTYIPNAPATYQECDPTLPDLSTLGLEAGRYILFLGRLVPEKRPNLLLEAFNQLKPPGWKLVLAGGASDTSSFRTTLFQMTQGNPNIVFTGAIEGELLSEIVRGAGLFVLPSDVEGLPLVMLEAMREKVPVLASNIPPHRQLIGEDRGLLFEAGNLQSCIEGLNQALTHPETLKAMAAKAQDHVKQNYAWDRIAFDNLSLYAKIAKKLRRAEQLQEVPASPRTETPESLPTGTGIEVVLELPEEMCRLNVAEDPLPLPTPRYEGIVG
ncbi:glycosyltransferase family 4 protein [Laspinema sp. A4]|uniref:glycosyltransferase family 4 protein n=1 Tax=Laspinema sp. D2d TaxID=2953686 RepID=UPI0021BA54FD|nr:glycosyltransferase family 4 protein [Laspinema sp. D2d]MCT7984812.1 glycosyltransferase family 4 protein [Laspinema sp. D2d]